MCTVELKQICKGKLVEPLWPMDYFLRDLSFAMLEKKK